MKESPHSIGKYVETVMAQAAKHTGGVCGDFVIVDRTDEATTTILADGIGTGVKARVAAVMCANRLMELIRLGFTIREACTKILDTMHEARTADIPFAAFSICRVLNNGHATILSYEIPPPVLVDKHLAAYLPQPRSYAMGLETIAETTCTLNHGDGIVLVSDGVTQAGLGYVYRMGWGLPSVSDFVNGCLISREDLRDVPGRVLGKVKEITGSTYGDDVTCLLLLCREAKALNIFTGPPSRRGSDGEMVRQFMGMDGSKVLCGSTTIEIFSRELKVPATIKGAVSDDYFKPPSYDMEGIDLATEGAITLSQVNNIMDEREEKLDHHSSVSQLYRLLHGSDTINFFVGTASNPAHRAVIFKQMGILPREAIVLLLVEKLKKMGKLVHVEYL